MSSIRSCRFDHLWVSRRSPWGAARYQPFLQIFVLVWLTGLGRPGAWADVWNAPLGGEFSDHTNWLDLSAPTSMDNVLFALPDTYNVTFIEPAATQDLSVSDGNVTFGTDGELFLYRIRNGGGDALIRGGDLMLGNARASLAPIHVQVDDELVVDAGSLLTIQEGSILEAGKLSVSAKDGGGAGSIVVTGDGSTLDVPGVGPVRLGAFGQNGVVTYQSGATGTIAGLLQLGNADSTPLTRGELNVETASSLTTSEVRIGNDGVPNDAMLGIGLFVVRDTDSSVVQTGASALTVDVGGLQVLNGASWSTSTGAVTVYEFGEIRVEGPASTFNLHGDLTIDAGGFYVSNGAMLNVDPLVQSISVENGGSLWVTNADYPFTDGLPVDVQGAFQGIQGSNLLIAAAAGLDFGVALGVGDAIVINAGDQGAVSFQATGASIMIGGSTAGSIDLNVLTGGFMYTLDPATIKAPAVIHVDGGTVTGNQGLVIDGGRVEVLNNGQIDTTAGLGLPFEIINNGLIVADSFLRLAGDGLIDAGGQIEANAGMIFQGNGTWTLNGGNIATTNLNVGTNISSASPTFVMDGASAALTTTGPIFVTAAQNLTTKMIVRYGASFDTSSLLAVNGAGLNDNGVADVNVESGADVRVGFLIIGDTMDTTNITSRVNVDGPGTRLECTDAVLGGTGVGVAELNVTNGASFFATTPFGFQLRPDGLLRVDGGTVDIDMVLDQGGLIDLLAGTLRMRMVGGLVLGIDRPFGDVLVLSPGQELVQRVEPLMVEPGAFVVLDGGTLRVQSFVAPEVTNDGIVVFRSGVLELSHGLNVGPGGPFGDTLDLGAVNFFSQDSGVLVQSARLLNSSHGSLDVAWMTVAGELNVLSGSVIARDAAGTSPGGVFTALDSTLSFPGNGAADTVGFNNDGKLNLFDVTVDGDVHSPVGSTIAVGGEVVFNGLVSGGGSFPGAGFVTFNGGYDPGGGFAQVSFDANLTLAAANTLFVDTGHDTERTTDFLTVAGTASVDGALQVDWVGAVPPIPGESFPIIEAALVDGAFQETQFPPISPGARWVVRYESTSIALTVAPQGDVNGDGSVTSEDLPAFADCLSGPGAPPSPSGGTTTEICLEVFDFVVGDQDVDLHDFSRFLLAFDGS